MLYLSDSFQVYMRLKIMDCFQIVFDLGLEIRYSLK